MRSLSMLGGVGVLVWLTATMGHVAVYGVLWPPLSGLVGSGAAMTGGAAMAFALGAFIVGLLLFLGLLYLVGAMSRLLSMRGDPAK